MKRAKHHIFCGKRYKVERVPPSKLKFKDLKEGEVCFGLCDPPTKKGKTIKIDNTLTDFDELQVLLHELLHCLQFSLSEDAVEEMSTDLAKFLWKEGYRKNG
jgi:hypothetical protein